MSLARRTVVLAVAVLLAACGSRAQGDADQAALAGGDAALRGPAVLGRVASAPGTESIGTTAAGSGGGASVPAGGGSAASPGDAAGGGEAAAADAGPQTGRGFTEDTVRIGYLTWNDVSNAGSAVGYAVDYGDQERIATAIADDLNARGGIAGRKVEVVFYDYPTGEILTNGAASDQAACSKFVEDQPVFAVIAVTGPQTEVLPQCLYDNQVTLVANDNIPYPRKYFEQWRGFFISTANPVTERLMPVWMQRSDAVGYFSGWDTAAGRPGPAPVKVGVLRSNSEAGELFRDILDASLKDLGHQVDSDYALDSVFDTNGMNSAVLQFRSEGITHVIVESLFLLLFPQAAESQRYRPRYTVTTANAPLLIQSATPVEQLRGAVGVGYFPSYDVDNSNDPGDPSPYAAHCRDLQRAAGNNPDQRESWNLQAKACDAFALIAEAVRLGGLQPTGISDGAARIQSLPPAGAFAITFGPGRQDGPGAVRDVGYDVECECFVFTGAVNHPLP